MNDSNPINDYITQNSLSTNIRGHLTIGSFIILTIIIIYKKEDKKIKFLNMFKDNLFVISAIITLIFVGYIFQLSNDLEKNRKLKRATEQAFIAFIIAIFAHLDLKVSAFWLVWLVSYFLHMN